ncbi:hypothetical protein DFQ27_004412 [Actinomortierella ambigua]|uniref:DUF7905 domain-containing protein n=1 Tax=Actinomortierella ambigua TaxID=1343610 RepID=A0A9P6Q379_9FUNG|nr:hypothetical protein DFQ27_004412 [Actinomortierella ambigua]
MRSAPSIVISSEARKYTYFISDTAPFDRIEVRMIESTEGLVPIPFPDECRTVANEGLDVNTSQETFPIYGLALSDDNDAQSASSDDSGPTAALNTSSSSIASSSSSVEGVTFELDRRIGKPFEFFFVDRSQTDDVREMIAEKHGCRVDADPTGRRMTFFGLEMDAVKALFVPLAQHDHYSKRIPFVPTRYPPVDQYHLHTLFKAVCARKSLITQQWSVTPTAHPLPGIHGMDYQNQPTQASRSSTSAAHSSWSSATKPTPPAPTKGYNDTIRRGDTEKWPPLRGSGRATASASSSKQQLRLMSSVVRPSGDGGETRTMREKAWRAPNLDSFEEADFPVVGDWLSQKEARDKTLQAASAATETTLTVEMNSELLQRTKLAEATSTAAAAIATPVTPLIVGIDEPPLISFDDEDRGFLLNNARERSKGRAQTHQPSLLDDDLLAKPVLMDADVEASGQQRSLRVLPLQRGSSHQPTSSLSTGNLTDNLYNYNLWKTMDVLKPALEHLQGRRKEIRLVGRLGHVVYDNVSAAATKQLWEYTNVEASVFENLGVRPVFSPAAFITQDFFDRFNQSIDNKLLVRSFFEFQCRSRTDPNSSYMPTIIKVPSDKAVLDLVVTPWDCFGSVKFDSLDRDHGMELRIEAREGLFKTKDSALGRLDVKPYNQFRKKISIGAESRSISCSAVENYLEVDNIHFKIEYLYKLPGSGDQFILKVTKVEVIVLERPSPILCTGITRGQGRTWFELEIEHQGVAKSLEENLKLKPRMVADWTIEEILGSQNPESAGVLKGFLQHFQDIQDIAEHCQHL